MEDILIKIAQLVMCLSIIVIVHEFGHFFFAKIFKMRVEKFYLFFDPWFSLFKFKPRNSDTEYGIGWLPIGGYVKISGMIDESLDTEQMKSEPKPWEFRSKPAWQRLLVMAAGVIFNFILALCIYSMIVFHWGSAVIDTSKLEDGMIFSENTQKIGFRNGDIIESVDGNPFILPISGMGYINKILEFTGAKEVTVKRDNQNITITIPEGYDQIIKNKDEGQIFDINRTTQIANIIEGSLAEQNGLKELDKILSINNVFVPNFDSLSIEVQKSANKTIPISYLRGTDTCSVEVTFGEYPQLGIQPNYTKAIVNQKFSILESFPLGFTMAIDMLKGYVYQMKFLFAKDGLSQLGGFGTIGSLFPTSWNWKAFWELTAFFSIAIGFVNILPIPALDGGHIIFILYEMITRKKPSDKFMQNMQVVGFVILLALILIANANDILRAFF